MILFLTNKSLARILVFWNNISSFDIFFSKSSYYLFLWCWTKCWPQGSFVFSSWSRLMSTSGSLWCPFENNGPGDVFLLLFLPALSFDEIDYILLWFCKYYLNCICLVRIQYIEITYNSLLCVRNIAHTLQILHSCHVIYKTVMVQPISICLSPSRWLLE